MWGRFYIVLAYEMYLKEFFKAADICSSQYVGIVDYVNFVGYSFGNEVEVRVVNFQQINWMDGVFVWVCVVKVFKRGCMVILRKLFGKIMVEGDDERRL